MLSNSIPTEIKMNREKSPKENTHYNRNYYCCSCGHGRISNWGKQWRRNLFVNKWTAKRELALAHIHLSGPCTLEYDIPDHSDVQGLEKSWTLLGRLQRILGALYLFQQAADAGWLPVYILRLGPARQTDHTRRKKWSPDHPHAVFFPKT